MVTISEAIRHNLPCHRRFGDNYYSNRGNIVDTGIKIDYSGTQGTHSRNWREFVGNIVNQPLVLSIVAVGVRLSIIRYPVWYDEAFTLWLSRLPVSAAIMATAGDVHPPLYYLISLLFARIFGPTVVSVRLVSLLFGVASVWLLGAVLMPLDVSRRTKTLTLWLAALSPFLIAYSNEMRMYALLLFIVLLAVYSLQRGNQWMLGVSIALGMWTQNLMVLYAVPLVLLMWHRRGFLAAVQSGVVSVVLYVPWISTLWHQLTAVKSAYWIPPLSAGRVIGIIYEATTEIATNPQTILITACVVLSLLVIGVIQAIKGKNWLILVMAWSPMLLGLIASLLFRPILPSPPRQLIGSTPFMILLIAMGAVWLYERLGKPVLALWIVPIVLVANIYTHPFKTLPMIAGIDITGTCYHLSTSSAIVAAVYAPNCNSYVWRGVDNLAQSISAQTKQAMGFDIRPIEDVPAGPVWVFYSDSPNTNDAATAEMDRILSKYPVIREYRNDKLGIISEHLYLIQVSPR